MRIRIENKKSNCQLVSTLAVINQFSKFTNSEPSVGSEPIVSCSKLYILHTNNKMLHLAGKNTSLNKSANTSCSTYDRFIPNRALMDNDKSHHMLMKDEDEDENVDINDNDGSSKEWVGSSAEANARILAMRCKAPAASDGIFIFHSIIKQLTVTYTSFMLEETLSFM